MKILAVLLLLFSTSVQAQDYLNDDNIDCFASAKNVKKPVYTIEPSGEFDAILLFPVTSSLVVEEFEEQSEDEPDFFNSGSCLRTAEGERIFVFCGSEKSGSNNLTAIRAQDSKGPNKVVYCEQAISTYVEGVPEFQDRWRRD